MPEIHVVTAAGKMFTLVIDKDSPDPNKRLDNWFYLNNNGELVPLRLKKE
jgi:hypothetical protein